MALKKEKKLINGVTLNYHRVVSVNSITNKETIIEVQSYISEEEREKEKEYYELQRKEEKTEEEMKELEKGINIFIDANFYSFPYSSSINIENAYEKLKELPEFEDSEDI